MTQECADISEHTGLTLSRPRLVVRVVGTLAVAACLAMVVLGTTRLSACLRGREFVEYWSGCFLLAVASILLASVDLLLLRRAYRRSRRALFEQEFKTRDVAEQLCKRQKEKLNE